MADLRKFLDQAGVATLWTKIDDKFARKTALDNLATKAELEPLALKTDLDPLATKAELEALDEKVGELPADSSDVISYINKKTEGIATDAALGELQQTVAGLTEGLEDEIAYRESVVADLIAEDTAQNGKIAALEEAVVDLEAEDTAQNGKIAALEETIKGLAGAMHFVGVETELPATENYNVGDVVIVGTKEYVIVEKANDNGEKEKVWEEFGDVSVNAAAIEQLTQRVETLAQENTAAHNTYAESIVKLDERFDNYYTSTEVDAAIDVVAKSVEALNYYEQSEVDSKIASAKAEAISDATAAAATDAKNKADQALADAKADTAEKLESYLTSGEIATVYVASGDIASGTKNGSISVKGKDIDVTGLGTAAFMNADAFASAAVGANAIHTVAVKSGVMAGDSENADIFYTQSSDNMDTLVWAVRALTEAEITAVCS